MPTYDYRCAACGHELEAFHSIQEPALRKCPKCKKPKLERLIGPGAGFLFKGGGFYQTDYRSESYKKAESSEKSAGEKPAAASDAAPAKSSGKDEGGGKSPPAAEKPKGAKPGPASKKPD